MRVLLTGASGFVGGALRTHLTEHGHAVICVGRGPSANFRINAINATTAWPMEALVCDAVVHLAARVHVMNETASDPLNEFRSVNTAGTLHLAREVARAGGRRFVFISSLKVNGESGRFSSHDVPAPEDPYSVSKWEAEQGLHQIGHETGMEIVIVRPPLVYGPGVAANFLRLMHALDKGLPFPFAAIDNRRSLVYLGNLVDAISTILTHPSAAGRTFLVGDGEDISTPQLICALSLALERRPRLFGIPPVLLRLVGTLTGKRATVERLLGSLCLDSSPLSKELGWKPPFTMQEGLRATADWYRATKGKPH